MIDNNNDLEFYKSSLTPNYYSEIKRASNNGANSLHRSSSEYMTLEDLEDILVDVLLLSKCDILIHSVSNMATSSLLINMNQQSICVSKPAYSGGVKQTAYVINLDKRPEKWDRIQNDFKDTDIHLERFKAIEHENGHVGCGESFKALIRMAKEKRMDSILVLEDDCKLLKNFNKRWAKIKEWLDNNKDKWNIFNGGVRYPLSSSFKYEVDSNNKLFTTKGGNYTHFMYFNSSGYDAVLNWEHSKNGLFDYYINSYELGNFLYIEPAIAIQYSGFSNTNNGEKNYEINGWVGNQKSKTNALPNNNTVKGGSSKKKKTRKNKKQKGGNNFKNVILVVVFNYADCVKNKNILKQIYEPYFKKVIFYSDIPSDNDPEINYIEISNGKYVHKIFPHLYNTYKDILDSSDGLFYTMDDNIINVNILNTFDSTKIIYQYPESTIYKALFNEDVSSVTNKVVYDLSTLSTWHWDQPYGKAAINNLLLDNSFKQYNLNEFIGNFSDFFYLPKKYITETLINLFDLFIKYNIFLEIAIPTIIYYSEKNIDMYQKFDATVLWGEDRKQTETVNGISDIFNKNPLIIHPIKLKGKDEIINHLINNIFKHN
jgi:hypothetical protein